MGAERLPRDIALQKWGPDIEETMTRDLEEMNKDGRNGAQVLELKKRETPRFYIRLLFA
jgi:hypothetical protein